jgi:cell fate regulator YaaT (PSP1 superfamily)
MDEQARLEQSSARAEDEARAVAESHGLPMKVVEAEPILGGERLTFYYTSDDRVDFRELVRELSRYRARIDMRQVGARDEARLTADYEKCGQYCCCKNFLKVLKPISMKSAKVQKATLDPVKISGRCGRLMCCLRYEDETYEIAAKKLPKRKARVGTPTATGS